MSKSKDRGTRWESAVVDFANEHGFPQIERRALRGVNDCGDLTGLPDWVLECKDEQRIELGTYMNEVKNEVQNDGAFFGAALVKRRQRPVGEGYAVLRIDDFFALLKLADW